MSLENPKVSVPGKWGHYTQIEVDHNQSPNSSEYWKIALMRRISFSPKPEVLLADLLAWTGYSATFSYGIVFLWKAGVSALFLTIPLLAIALVVGIWVRLVADQMGNPFLELVSKRVLIVLLGFTLGVYLW